MTIDRARLKALIQGCHDAPKPVVGPRSNNDEDWIRYMDARRRLSQAFTLPDSLTELLSRLEALEVAINAAMPHMEHGAHLAYKRWLADDTDESWAKMQAATNALRDALSPPTPAKDAT